MRKKLYIVGSGGLARETAQLCWQINELEELWDIQGYVSGSQKEVGETVGGLPVVGTDEFLMNLPFEADVLIGIGSASLKRKIFDSVLSKNPRLFFPNVIHPSATIDRSSVRLGRGNIVSAGCRFTCDIQIGDFNLFNLNTTVGHDTRIGSYAVINPGVNLSGGIVMGDEVLIGTGAQVLEGLKIASRTTLGSGAVLTKDVPEGGLTYVGIPAKVLELRR